MRFCLELDPAALMKSLAGFGVVLALSATVPAQQPLQTRFVLASVADQAGSPVLGLAPADFVIEEDGVRRDALDVRPATYPIAIMLDTSSTARQNFMLMRKAVAA